MFTLLWRYILFKAELYIVRCDFFPSRKFFVSYWLILVSLRLLNFFVLKLTIILTIIVFNYNSILNSSEIRFFKTVYQFHFLGIPSGVFDDLLPSDLISLNTWDIAAILVSPFILTLGIHSLHLSSMSFSNCISLLLVYSLILMKNILQ